jgi:hypothetical protein
MHKIIDFFLDNSGATDMVELESQFDKKFGPDRDFWHYLRSYYGERKRLGYAEHARQLKKLVDRLAFNGSQRNVSENSIGNSDKSGEQLREEDKISGSRTNHYSINDGEQLLKNKSAKIHEDLIALQGQMKKIRSKDGLKDRIVRYFSEAYWTPEYRLSKKRRWAMDYVKEEDCIGVEIELGNSREIIFRDLMRFGLLHEKGKINVGIIIVYANDKSVATRNNSEGSQKRGKSNPYMNLDYLIDVCDDYRASIKVPLWCIGV